MHKIYIIIITLIILSFSFLLYNTQHTSSMIINSIKNVSPSVVSIIVLDENNDKKSFGSGFIYDREGFIITNTHVIEDSENILEDLKNERIRRIEEDYYVYSFF